MHAPIYKAPICQIIIKLWNLKVKTKAKRCSTLFFRFQKELNLVGREGFLSLYRDWSIIKDVELGMISKGIESIRVACSAALYNEEVCHHSPFLPTGHVLSILACVSTISPTRLPKYSPNAQFVFSKQARRHSWVSYEPNTLDWNFSNCEASDRGES